MLQKAGRVTFVYISTCGASGSVRYRRRAVLLSCTFQRAVLEALCGTDGDSCHIHCTVPADLRGAGVLLCLSLVLNLVYLTICAKIRLVVGMTKSNGKEVDIVNC